MTPTSVSSSLFVLPNRWQEEHSQEISGLQGQIGNATVTEGSREQRGESYTTGETFLNVKKWAPMERLYNMQEEMGNVRRERRTLKNNKNEMLEIRNTAREMKHVLWVYQ